MPAWITGDVLDIRKAVHILLDAAPDKRSNSSEQTGRHVLLLLPSGKHTTDMVAT